MSPAAVAVSPAPFELPRVWGGIALRAPALADTMTGYVDDLSARLAPRSVAAAEVCLRDFSLHALAAECSVRSAREVTASHVADWCTALAERAVSAETINYKLDVLRRFFEHLHDHNHRDAPTEIPVARRPRPFRPPRVVLPVQKPKAVKKPRSGEPKPPSRALPKETTWEVQARWSWTRWSWPERVGVSPSAGPLPPQMVMAVRPRAASGV